MDRLTAMRVFAEVATSGSFSATADKLDMSRAMVTRYVAEMEQWLQARLLQRNAATRQGRAHQRGGLVGAEGGGHAHALHRIAARQLPHAFAKVGVAQAAVPGQVGGLLRGAMGG